MYYPNYNPYYVHNYYTNNNTKKDTVPKDNGTISFPKTDNTKNNKSEEKDKDKKLFSFDKDNVTLLGFTMQTDDLIILALICLLFIESDENYALIIILFLILTNTNLSDILSIF